MACKQQGVHVLLGIDHPVLIECSSALCQYHCCQTIVLSHHKVIFLNKVDQLKIRRITALLHCNNFGIGAVYNMRGIGNQDNGNLSFVCLPYSQINYGTGICVD